VEYDNNASWGNNLYATDGLKLITWGYRFLWVLLFIALVVPMGQFHKPLTLPFLGAVLVFILPTLFDSKTLFDTLEGDELEYFLCNAT